MISPGFPIQKTYNDTWVWAELHQAATQEMKTETLIPLPTKWEDNLGNAPMAAEWRKRRLIEE